MKTRVILLGILFAVAGCSQHSDGRPSAAKEICIKGVTYYASGYHLAPAFLPDGSLIACEVTVK